MRRFKLASAVLMTLAAIAPEAQARRCRPAQSRARVVVRQTPRRVRMKAVLPVPAVVPVAVPVAVPAPVASPQSYAPGTNDAAGFVVWLNATRASYGLAAVGYDPGLAGWAAANNTHQSARGVGHFVMGPARRQNSAAGDYATAGGMWMASPAHRAALLDPTIRAVGIAGTGGYLTFNAW